MEEPPLGAIIITSGTEKQESINYDKEYVLRTIRQYFGNDPTAVRVADCESDFIADAVGDEQFAFTRNGELWGRSIGVLQIRTSGREWRNGQYYYWNRASEKGMTIKEFEEWLKIPENNISYGKELRDRYGWGIWSCY